MASEELELREAIIAKCRWMNDSGLNQGTSGNISARFGPWMLITPSGVPYEAMAPEMLAAMALDDAEAGWEGPLKPSTEWRFHRDILRARPDVAAVVHTHSPWCAALSITRRPIPAAHYMVALFGGNDVRCAEYATFGTAELSRAALAALEGRNACLLANHGMIATGPDLDRAMRMAVELETLARQYVTALAIGGPVLLTDEELAEAAGTMKGYGPAAG
jgi:L-fuculose-phosphate aldolase